MGFAMISPNHLVRILQIIVIGLVLHVGICLSIGTKKRGMLYIFNEYLIEIIEPRSTHEINRRYV